MQQLNYLAFGSNSNLSDPHNLNNPNNKSDFPKNIQSKKRWLDRRFSKKIYAIYKIAKRNGTERLIISPCFALKRIQRTILKSILYQHSEILSSLNRYCFGFMPNSSIVDNAKIHLNRKYILKIDLKDFFPSINSSRVYGIFSKYFKYNRVVSQYLTGLCTYKNMLPQGAPTSPMLANMVAHNMDKQIAYKLLSSFPNVKYSRYADDLTFSYDDKSLTSKLLLTVATLIEKNGFIVNRDKLRIIGNNQPQYVTGITVNNSNFGIGRKYYRELRATINNINVHGMGKSLVTHNMISEENLDMSQFINYIFGKISFLQMISPHLARKLLESWKEIKD